MSEHRIRLDDKDLARIEKCLVLCLTSPGMETNDLKVKQLLSRLRRTRLHGITGRPSRYIPQKRTGTYSWEDDFESYLEELNEYL